MKEPRCAGEVKPPETSADCKAACDARVTAKTECRPAQVGVVVTGAADPKVEAAYKATLEKNLPAVLRVASGIGDRAAKTARAGKAVVESAKAGVGEVAKTARDPGQSSAVASKISGCFGDGFDAAIAAGGGLKADVDAAVNVRTTTSAAR
jgi:hypothetical protein